MTAHTKEGSRGIKFDHDSYASLLIHIITQSCYKTAEIWNTADIVVCCVSWSDCRAHCLASPLSLLFSVACFLLRGVGGGGYGGYSRMFCTGRLCHEVQPLTLSQCIYPVYLIKQSWTKLQSTLIVRLTWFIDFGDWIKSSMEFFVSLIIEQTECNQTELCDFGWLLNKLLTKPKS